MTRCVALLIAGALAGVAGVDLYVARELGGVRRDTGGAQHAIAKELAELRRAGAEANAEQSDEIESLLEQLTQARVEVVALAAEAQHGALLHARALAQRLERARRRLALAASDELDSLHAMSTAAQAEIDSLESDIRQTRLNAASSRAHAAGQQAAGDGLRLLMDGASANAKWLAELKALGQRQYFEFSLKRGGETHEIGEVGLRLRRLDWKRRRCSIEVSVRGASLTLAERTLLEPARFYLNHDHRPAELVVDAIDRHGVSGYLAVPKEAEIALRYEHVK